MKAGRAALATSIAALLAVVLVQALKPRVPLPSGDFLKSNTPAGFSLSGIGTIEKDDNGSWRWMDGPQASVSFTCDRPQRFFVRFVLGNPTPEQGITVEVNGQPLKRYARLARGAWLAPCVTDSMEFEARTGVNTIMFRFDRHNHSGAVIAEKDARPLAQVLLGLKVYSQVF